MTVKEREHVNQMLSVRNREIEALTPKWIDVNLALPKISNLEETYWVLACDSRGEIFTAKFMQYDEEEPAQWYEFGRDCYQVDAVCFWMELPKAPVLNP